MTSLKGTVNCNEGRCVQIKNVLFKMCFNLRKFFLTDIIYGHTESIVQPIRPFVLSIRHPPSPNALSAPGLVDVVHRDRGGLRLTAGL